MTCLRPRMAYDTGLKETSGKRKISFSPRWPHQSGFPVPCGKCPACLQSRRNQWVSRMRCEALGYDCSSFITLTYDNEHVPSTLVKEHLQRFFKRLRNVQRDFGVPSDCRYFGVGEYGKRHGRPHYHAIVFGLDFLSPAWLPRLVGSDGQYPVYCSDLLYRVWPYGYNVVGRATDADMRYCSKYITKSLEDKSSYSVPPFALWSIGLGRSLFVDSVRHGRSVSTSLRPCFEQHYKDGSVYLPSRGGYSRVRCPSCLDNYAERLSPSLFQAVKDSRRAFSLHYFDDRLPADRQKVIFANLSAENQERFVDNET